MCAVQVLSMLGSEHDAFRAALEGLVRRVCSEHPHHTLLQLFGLYHGKRVNAQDKQAYEAIPRLDDKIKAAERVLTRLKASAPLASLLANVEKLLDGYIALANTNTLALVRANCTKNVDFTAIPKAPAVVRSFPHILGRSTSTSSSRGSSSSSASSAQLLLPSTVPAVLTHWPALDPSGSYPEVVRVAGFEPRFTLADAGLSRPMIIVCLGSDGKKYRQVLKADDLRPDAVMMQVFDTMNTLLQQVRPRP
jgi:ataxia telangiectasia mutated family protein